MEWITTHSLKEEEFIILDCIQQTFTMYYSVGGVEGGDSNGERREEGWMGGCLEADYQFE